MDARHFLRTRQHRPSVACTCPEKRRKLRVFLGRDRNLSLHLDGLWYQGPGLKSSSARSRAFSLRLCTCVLVHVIGDLVLVQRCGGLLGLFWPDFAPSTTPATGLELRSPYPLCRSDTCLVRSPVAVCFRQLGSTDASFRLAATLQLEAAPGMQVWKQVALPPIVRLRSGGRAADSAVDWEADRRRIAGIERLSLAAESSY